MLRLIITIVLLLYSYPAFAKNAPNFFALKKSWGELDSFSISKSEENKYTVTAGKGKISVSRDLYMISSQNPELVLWFFHGSGPDSPEIIIRNMGLKDLSSWYNTLIVIVDSGASLYPYNPDEGLPELQIYCAIYDKLIKMYGIQPAILAGIASGAEGAVKFAPFVKKLYSLICISGIYNYNLLPKNSEEYKIRLKGYGSPGDWELEMPDRILPLLKCSIILLSEEDSIYRVQAEKAARLKGAKGIKYIKEIGKGRFHDWNFWGSAEVKKILQREIQAAGGS